jgi:transcriptional regulator with XRE-family HTH domain
MESFAEALAALLDEKGLSANALARQIPCNRALISRFRNGTQQPSVRLAQRCDEVLGAGGELAALAQAPALLPVPGLAFPGLAPDADLYARITRVVEDPERADLATAQWLERCLDEHRRIEDTIGGRPLLAVVREQLRVVADLARCADGPLAVRLVSLAAQYAQFMAWLCMDNHDQGAALAWYDRAHGWAVEAGDANMAATTLSMRAHQAWSSGQPRRCITLAEAARWHEGRTTPGVQGMAAQMAARGHAVLGRDDPAHARAAHTEFDQAEVLIRRAAAQPDDEPVWMYFYGETWFRLQRGMAELHLGNWAVAAQLLRDGLEVLGATYRRDRAWYAACQARALAEAGDAEQAREVAVRHAADIVAVNSYARGEMNRAVAVLTARGAREGAAIRDALAEPPARYAAG